MSWQCDLLCKSKRQKQTLLLWTVLIFQEDNIQDIKDILDDEDNLIDISSLPFGYYTLYVTINGDDYTLGSHKYYPVERVFAEMTPAMLHRSEDKEGLTDALNDVRKKRIEMQKK